MKVKTSLTLSEDVLRGVKRLTARGESRSEAIERLLREAVASRRRRASDARDLSIINRHAAELNVEAEDVLSYQADV